MSDVQRLSEHILLGDTLAAREGSLYYSVFDKCGCALGRAMLSVGVWASDKAHPDAVISIISQWPWLNKICPDPVIESWSPRFFAQISGLFNRVCQEKMTIEALAQQVREWEDLYDDALRSQVTEVSELTQEKKHKRRKKRYIPYDVRN